MQIRIFARGMGHTSPAECLLPQAWMKDSNRAILDTRRMCRCAAHTQPAISGAVHPSRLQLSRGSNPSRKSSAGLGAPEGHHLWLHQRGDPAGLGVCCPAREPVSGTAAATAGSSAAVRQARPHWQSTSNRF